MRLNNENRRRTESSSTVNYYPAIRCPLSPLPVTPLPATPFPTVLFLLILVCLSGCRPAASDRSEGEDNAPPKKTSVQNDAESSTPASTDSMIGQSDDEASVEDRPQSDALIIGLDADMSSASAQAGLAIKRGVVLAIEEINAAGGLLGRQLELVMRDHRGNPDRGVDNIIEFAAMPNVLAVVGGIHTPVALRELRTIHDSQMIYLGPWAAGTPIVENEFSPNYVFRVSVRDEYAGGFLVDSALDRGLDSLGLLLERTGWGRSNEVAIQNALRERGKEHAHVEWFNLGETDLTPQLARFDDAGVNGVLMVCNPIEGRVAIEAIAAQEPSKRVPVISHWGITGSNFFDNTKEFLSDVDLSFLQTCSFIRPKHAVGLDRLYQSYASRFEDCQSPRDIFSPVGTVHAYEIVMMLAAAVKLADTDDRPAIRDAMERLGKFQGVMRDYDPPFTSDDHDALGVEDLTLAKFGKNGVIEPLERASPRSPAVSRESEVSGD